MSEDRRKGCFKLTCFGCVAMPFLAIMVTYGTLKCQVSKIGRQLPQELASLRSLHVPVEPAELVPDPPIPPGENAAELLNSLIEELKKAKEQPFYKEGNKAVGDLSANHLWPEDDPVVVAMVEQLKPFLQKTDQIQDKSRLDFSRDWSKGAALLFPELAYLKEIAKLQSYRSRIAAKVGDHQTSLQALRTTFALYRLCAEEPTIIAALVAIAIHSIGYSALEFHLEHFRNNEGALEETLKMLEAIPESIDLRRPLYGEVVMTRQWFRSLADSATIGAEAGYLSDSETALSIAMRDPQVREMFEVRYLQLWVKAFHAMPTDSRNWREVQKAGTVIDRELEKTLTADTYLNQMLFPVLGQYPQAAGAMQARQRLAILGTRLLLDRPKGLPSQLTRYGRAAFDPLDGLPMRYIRKGNGFKIWSIGKDLVDDGGKKYWRNARMSSQETDEVLMFDYPELPPKTTAIVGPANNSE